MMGAETDLISGKHMPQKKQIGNGSMNQTKMVEKGKSPADI